MDHSRLVHVHACLKTVERHGKEVGFAVEKPYKNNSWVMSHEAKRLRIMAEIDEPVQRFEACGINNTILFFGSARGRSPEAWQSSMERAEATLADPSASEEDKKKASSEKAQLGRIEWMCDVYKQTQELSRRLAEWSMGRLGALDPERGTCPYTIASGGGPGLMEAANRGASMVPGAITAGIAISLPFESCLNKFCTPEASLLHHYFFTRKLALVQSSRALIVSAGGWGSLDELFEVLTLLQTGKVEHAEDYPVVLFPASYWKKVIDQDFLVERGVIASHDLGRVLYTDDIVEAFTYITSKLLRWEEKVKASKAAAVEAAKALPKTPAAAAYDAKVQEYLQQQKNKGLVVSATAAAVAGAGTSTGFDVASPVPLPGGAAASAATPVEGSSSATGVVVSPLGAQ